MRTVCHNTYWTERSHFITRTLVAQDCISLCPKTIVIHVSCLFSCRTWHWPQAQVLSHLPHLFSDNLTNKHKTLGARSIFTLRSSTAGWRINTNPISHRLWAQSHRAQSDRAQKNWAWQESWDRSVSNTEFFLWEITAKIPSLKMWMNLEKLVPRCPTSSHRCIPIMTQRKALQTRILKMENHENAGFTTVYAKSRRLWILSNANQSVLKLTTPEEKARCQVHLRNRVQRGNLLQCFH